MQQPEIYALLAEIFHDTFDDTSIVLRSDMTADDVPGWDSFNHINLIIAVEAEFKIKFQTAELEKLHNVGALAVAIKGKLEKESR